MKSQEFFWNEHWERNIAQVEEVSFAVLIWMSLRNDRRARPKTCLQNAGEQKSKQRRCSTYPDNTRHLQVPTAVFHGVDIAQEFRSSSSWGVGRQAVNHVVAHNIALHEVLARLRFGAVGIGTGGCYASLSRFEQANFELADANCKRNSGVTSKETKSIPSLKPQSVTDTFITADRPE